MKKRLPFISVLVRYGLTVWLLLVVLAHSHWSVALALTLLFTMEELRIWNDAKDHVLRERLIELLAQTSEHKAQKMAEAVRRSDYVKQHSYRPPTPQV